MLIRRAERSDDQQIVDLFKRLSQESGGIYPRQARVEEDGGLAAWLRLDRGYPRWVAETESGQIIGHGQILVLSSGVADLCDYYQMAFAPLDVGELAILQRLAVDSAWRRKGIASQLVQVRSDWAKGQGLLPAVVINRPQEASRQLYTEAGWRKVRDYSGLQNSEMASYVSQ